METLHSARPKLLPPTKKDIEPCNYMLVKKYLEVMILSAVSVFAPIKATIATVAILILADFITGVLAARKRGEIISSAAMRRSITKIFIYELCLCCAFLFEHYITEEAIPATKMVASLISLVEIKSILENSDTINGASVFKSLVKKLGSDNQDK